MSIPTTISWIVLFIILDTTCCFSQKNPPSKLSFEYISPRNGRAVTASDFINTIRPEPNAPNCYFTIATYRFRITQSMEIDSIALEGKLLDNFNIPLQKQIRDSQPYWKCQDCSHSQGHWIRVPVYISLTCADNCSPTEYPHFYQSRKEYGDLFEGISDGVLQLTDSEWALALMYFFCIR